MRNHIAPLVCLLALFAGCIVRTPGTGYAWDTQGDQDAAYAQSLMRQTVEVDHHLSIMFSDGSGQLQVVTAKKSGTGVVFAASPRKSLVLTADHVCRHVEKIARPVGGGEREEYPVLGELFSVWTIEQLELPARVVYSDGDNDICVLEVSGHAGEPATLLVGDPPVGAVVQHVGSPDAILEYRMAYVVDGRYMGREEHTDGTHYEVSSVPADHGCSGGGMFYHGRLFALLVKVDEPFKTISFSTGDGPLRRAVAEGIKAWR